MAINLHVAPLAEPLAQRLELLSIREPIQGEKRVRVEFGEYRKLLVAQIAVRHGKGSGAA
jgi:hypothetical protein